MKPLDMTNKHKKFLKSRKKFFISPHQLQFVAECLQVGQVCLQTVVGPYLGVWNSPSSHRKVGPSSSLVLVEGGRSPDPIVLGGGPGGLLVTIHYYQCN